MKSTVCVFFLAVGSFCLSLSVMCDTKITTPKVANLSEWTEPHQLASSENKNKIIPTFRLQGVANLTNETKPVTEGMNGTVFSDKETTFNSISNYTTAMDEVTVRHKIKETTRNVTAGDRNLSNPIIFRLQGVTNSTNETKPVTEGMNGTVFSDKETTFNSISNYTTAMDEVTVRHKIKETTRNVTAGDLNLSNAIIFRLQGVTNPTNETKPVTKGMNGTVFSENETTCDSISNYTAAMDEETVRSKSKETMTNVTKPILADDRQLIDVAPTKCGQNMLQDKSGVCKAIAK